MGKDDRQRKVIPAQAGIQKNTAHHKMQSILCSEQYKILYPGLTSKIKSLYFN